MRRPIRFSLLPIVLLLLCAITAHADVVLQDLDGNAIPFSSLKGKWVFINYWASWCSPCVDEIAEFNRFYDQNKTHNIAVFAVQFDALSTSKQKRLAQKFGIHYPSLQHHSLRPLHFGDISVVPITFVFNPEGTFTTALYGGQTADDLERIQKGA